MTWSAADLSTDALDAGTDTPPRAQFLRLFQIVKALLAARGTAGGVAGLDTSGYVPDAQTGRAAANGTAPLDANALLPRLHLPAASSAAAGALRLATAAETAALTRGELAVSPAELGAVLRDRLLGFAVFESFTAAGTFTPPAGVTRVYGIVFAAGGGGGGGHARSLRPLPKAPLRPVRRTGGSGGLGGLSAGFATVVPGTDYSVSVGTGGARGATAAGGSDGGDSSFAGLSATGGTGGGGASVATTWQGAHANGAAGAIGTGSGGNYASAIDATGPVRDFLLPRAQDTAVVDALFALFETVRALRRARDGSAAEAWSVDGAYWPGAGGAGGHGNGNNASGGSGGGVFIAY